MAELAHDASGPASSEPTGTIPQQASGPVSSDKGKLRVFISYSRDDLKFADQLDAALDACGFECLIDRHGISGGEDWKRRLGNLISEADTVVFVVSPSSARSEICDWEVEEAARLNKRILPVICRPLEGVSPPPRLRDLNYMFFYEEPKMTGSGFGTGLAKLVAALNTDFDWLREHTRYLQRAMEWDKGGRPANRLLSGNDILDAKAWLARRPKGAPEPTTLHLDFIRASEEESAARLSEQRKHLEAMAAAQAERETALHDREEALKAAEERRQQAEALLGGATTIIVKFESQMDTDTKKQAFALIETGAKHGDRRSMFNLGVLYGDGNGVPQDYAKAREWYEKAAAKDHAGAMNNLGLLYRTGQGVTQDYAKAREWYEKAAAKDDAGAMNNLGILYNRGEGVSQDYIKAHEWFEKAAAKDDADAMDNLSALYFQGHGVPQDYAKALEWAEKAADKGHRYAMAKLGWHYDKGRGVPQDSAKAREWYEKAAAKDNANAKLALERLAIREAATTGRYAEALQLQEAFAAKVEAEETKRDGKPGEQTATELIYVTWYALFAKGFAKALSVADRAHELFPDNLSIETNRAHALMFLERGEECKTLHLAYKGKPMSEERKELWESVIVKDFAEFRKVSLTHPMMADIEKELTVSR